MGVTGSYSQGDVETWGVHVTTRRRTATAVGILAAVVLAASGCSLASDGKDAARDAAAAQVVRAAYAKTTSGETAKVRLDVRTSGGGTPLALSGDGVVDFGTRKSQLRLNIPTIGTTDVRTVAGVTYVRVPASFAVFTGGKPWVKLDRAALGAAGMGALGDSGTTDPADVLAYLAGASDKVTKVGEETVATTPTTRYRVEIDLRKAARDADAAGRAAAASAEKVFGSPTLPADVWLDRDGRLRKLVLRQTVAPAASPSGASASAAGVELYVALTLPEFGVPVHVTAPRAAEVADLGALTGRR
jgi:hypothetical protein